MSFRTYHRYVILTPSMSNLHSRLAVCTFFVYLNDVPLDSGGSTRFPLLKDSDGKVLEVQPVKGSAVLWSNITKEGDVDPLTVHEGVAITRGKKYGMNIWVTD